MRMWYFTRGPTLIDSGHSARSYSGCSWRCSHCFLRGHSSFELGRKKANTVREEPKFFLQRFFFSFDENGPKIPPAFVCYFLSACIAKSLFTHFMLLFAFAYSNVIRNLCIFGAVFINLYILPTLNALVKVTRKHCYTLLLSLLHTCDTIPQVCCRISLFCT